MRRLARPPHSMVQAVDACADGIVEDAAFREMVRLERPCFSHHEGLYIAHAVRGQLFAIGPIADPANGALAVGGLTRGQLKTLYAQFFVPAQKPGRSIYTALMLAAADQCPFCGGIGTPANLDHFLPKEHFPEFSVLPFNLVPACRDCNMGAKGARYATDELEQAIHPYADKECFFTDRWITCEYVAADLRDAGTFVFRAEPPAHWEEVDKQRAQAHFVDFEIARRYGVQAAELLGTVLAQLRMMRRHNVPREVAAEVLTTAVDEAPFVNHWRAGMHLGLSTWFVAHDRWE